MRKPCSPTDSVTHREMEVPVDKQGPPVSCMGELPSGFWSTLPSRSHTAQLPLGSEMAPYKGKEKLKFQVELRLTKLS